MTTSTTEAVDYSEWNGKAITVVRNLSEPNDKGETSVEIEGTCQVGNADALLIKPKGKITFDLIPASEIEDVFLTPTTEKGFKRSRLKPVAEGQMRRHLLDRHAITLDWINKASEADAVAYHDSLDHEKLDLGHHHAEASSDDAAGDEGQAAPANVPDEY